MVLQHNPLISVGIPVYNGEKYLATAIQSVLDQSYSNLEIIISDNCSTDNSVAIVMEFQKKDSRVKLIKNAANIGFIKNFNSLPLQATGEYFIFFADDDIYDKDFIKLLWNEFLKNPGIAIAIGSVKLITMEGQVIEHINNFSAAKVESTVGFTPADRVARVIRYGHNREWSWGLNLALYKKEVLLKHPYSNKIMDPGTLFYRSVIFEGDIAVNENALFYKRIGGLSSAENYGRTKDTVRIKFNDIKNEVLQLYGEFKVIGRSSFSFAEKLKVRKAFLSYRFPELLKRIFLFIASFFSFILVKKPKQFFRSLFK
jgi:glycosyltransferase involved in cell wall biosynthesis